MEKILLLGSFSHDLQGFSTIPGGSLGSEPLTVVVSNDLVAT